MGKDRKNGRKVLNSTSEKTKVKKSKPWKRPALFQKKKEKEKGEKFSDKKKLKKQVDKGNKKAKSLRFTLIVSFLIPVLFIAALGITSYKQASDAMIENYEESAQETMDAVDICAEIVLEDVEKQTIRLSSDSSFTSYLGKKNVEDTARLQALIELRKEITTTKVTSQSIQSLTTIGEYGNGISTLSSTANETIYAEFIKSEQGKIIHSDEKLLGIWMGYNKFIDQIYNVKDEDYAVSYVRKVSKGKAYILVNISSSYIISLLDGLYTDGGMTGFISPDGREIVSTETTVSEGTSVFLDSSFYQEAVNSEDEKGFSYVTAGGKEYLFVYNKVGETGMMFCNLIPKSVILSEAKQIGRVTIYISVLAVLAALFIGFWIATSIGKTIKTMMQTMKKVSEGDLTVIFETKRKDEFKVLSQSVSEMLSNMQGLIQNVAQVSQSVMESAEGLSSTSERILDSSKNITLAVNEVAIGSSQQVLDADTCYNQMTALSEKINEVYDSTNCIEAIFEDTKTTVSDGLEIVNNLNEKAKATTAITNVITEEVERLEESSANIGMIVNAINEIADQTDLLSLNASIEAARAGEAGRGFAVVADEIRNLATKSMEAANQIHEIITSIQQQTKHTANSAKKAEEIIRSQETALGETTAVFDKIQQQVGQLVGNLSQIKVGMDKIDTAKQDTLDSVQNISTVSEQSAAAAQEVSATSTSQTEEMSHLATEAESLAKEAKRLQESIQKFRI